MRERFAGGGALTEHCGQKIWYYFCAKGCSNPLNSPLKLQFSGRAVKEPAHFSKGTTTYLPLAGVMYSGLNLGCCQAQRGSVSNHNYVNQYEEVQIPFLTYLAFGPLNVTRH